MKRIIAIILATVILCLMAGAHGEDRAETTVNGQEYDVYSDIMQAVYDALAAVEENGETDRETVIAGLTAAMPDHAEEIRTLVDIYAAINDGETMNDPEAVLPAYRYTGEDSIEGAIANALAGREYMELYLTKPGCVCIPCPIILKTEMSDDTHARVYGVFWTLNYVQVNHILLNISGGEHTGIILLEKGGETWQVTELQEAGEEGDFDAEIARFAGGDRKLAEQYRKARDLSEDPQLSIRKRFIREYAEANSLDVNAFMDPYWNPVPLE